MECVGHVKSGAASRTSKLKLYRHETKVWKLEKQVGSRRSVEESSPYFKKK